MQITLKHLDNITLEEVLYSKAGINLRFRIHLHFFNDKFYTQSILQVDEEIRGPDDKVRRMIYASCPESHAKAALEIFNEKIEGI